MHTDPVIFTPEPKIFTPDTRIISPEMIVVPRQDRLPRICLAKLRSGAYATAGAQVALINQEIKDRDRAFKAAAQEMQDHKRHQHLIDRQQVVRHYECACFLVYLDDHGLTALHDCKTVEGYYQLLFPDAVVLSTRHLRNYLWIARFVPEEVFLSEKASIKLMTKVGRVQGGAAGEMLCAMILKGAPRNAIEAGADAAIEALEAKAPQAREARARQAIEQWYHVDGGGAREEKVVMADYFELRAKMDRLMAEAKLLGLSREDLEAGGRRTAPVRAAGPDRAGVEERQTPREEAVPRPKPGKQAGRDSQDPAPGGGAAPGAGPAGPTDQGGGTPAPAAEPVPEAKPEPTERGSNTTTQAAEPVPTARPAAEPVPAARPAAEPVPAARPAAEPVPTARPAAEPVPTARPATEPVPTARPAAEPVPTARPAEGPVPAKASGQSQPDQDERKASSPQPKQAKRRRSVDLINELFLVDDGVEYTPRPIPLLPPPPPPPPLAIPDYSHHSPEKQALMARAWATVAEVQSQRTQLPHPLPILVVDEVCCSAILPKQVGLIGFLTGGRSVAVDLYRPVALTVVGPPNMGKGWFIGTLVENFTMPIPGVNNLTDPFCAVSLHYHTSDNYQSELLQAVYPAQDPEHLALLEQHGLSPEGHPDVLVLTAPIAAQVAEMRRLHPHAQVHSLKPPLRELSNQALRYVLGLDQKETPQYAREVSKMLRELLQETREPTLMALRKKIESFNFSAQVRPLILQRLDWAAQWIDDSRSLRAYIKKGRLILVEISSDLLTEEEAMMLFALATDVLVISAGNSKKTKRCPLLLIYDEAHLFTRWAMVRQQMDMVVRQRRHLKTSVVLSSQDPSSLPTELLPLMDGIGALKHHSVEFLKVLKKIDPFNGLTMADFADLEPGEMFFWTRSWFQVTKPEREEEEDEAQPEEEKNPLEQAIEKLRYTMSENTREWQNVWDGKYDEPDEEGEEEEEDEEEEEEEDEDKLDGSSVVRIKIRPRVTCHGGESTTAETEDDDEDVDTDDEDVEEEDEDGDDEDGDDEDGDDEDGDAE